MADTTHTIEQDITRIKEDVASLKQDMVRVKEDIAGIKGEMKYFATKADLEAVKGSIEHMGRTLIMWHVSSMIALAGIIVAIFKFMR